MCAAGKPRGGCTGERLKKVSGATQTAVRSGALGGIQVIWLTAAGGASLAVEVNADTAAPDPARAQVGFNIDIRRVSRFDPATEARL